MLYVLLYTSELTGFYKYLFNNYKYTTINSLPTDKLNIESKLILCITY